MTFNQKLSKKIRKDTSHPSKENVPRWTLNSEHLGSKCKGIHFHQRTFTKAQSTHYISHNNSGRLQHSNLNNGQIMETENNQRHNVTNRTYEPNDILTDICRTFHPKTKEYTFFSAPHGTFSKIGLNQYKKIEIIPASYQTTTN